MITQYKCSRCKLIFEIDSTTEWAITEISKGKISIFCSTHCKLHEKPKHKFNAIACESDGIKFSSKAERSYYHRLKELWKTGEVLFFLRQVPFALPGNTKYVVDFQVFYANGTVSFVDVKGLSTPMFILKKKQVESLYPIKIEIVKM